MIGSNSSDYYRRRADQATRLADAATMPTVREIHRDMAARYVALAEAGDAAPARPTLRLAF